MVDIKELHDKISEQVFKCKNAQSGAVVAQEKERLKNIMINNADAIVEALKYAIDSKNTILRLETEIESADAELKVQDEELKTLREAAAAKEKKKKAVDADGK